MRLAFPAGWAWTARAEASIAMVAEMNARRSITGSPRR